MNIFLHELRSNLKSLLIWIVIVILFNVVGFSKFSAFYGNPELLKILDSYPPALLAALSMNAFNLTTVTGFFGVMNVYFSLILTIAAAMWGTDIISKEERDRTVEFSLTLPIPRSKLVTGKAAAAAVNCVILLLLTWGTTLLNAQRFAPDSDFNGFVALTMLSFFILQMVFLALGIFLGCALKKYKRAGAIAMTILLSTYFASILAGLSKNLEFLKYFSPFKYFEAAKLLHESQLEITFVLLSTGIIVAAMIGAYVMYARRDLYI